MDYLVNCIKNEHFRHRYFQNIIDKRMRLNDLGLYQTGFLEENNIRLREHR